MGSMAAEYPRCRSFRACLPACPPFLVTVFLRDSMKRAAWCRAHGSRTAGNLRALGVLPAPLRGAGDCTAKRGPGRWISRPVGYSIERVESP